MEKQSPYRSELELLLRLSKGDENAYTYIYNVYHDEVLKLSQTFTNSVSRAEELTLGVFATVWVKRQELPFVTSFVDFLFSTAHEYLMNETIENCLNKAQ